MGATSGARPSSDEYRCRVRLSRMRSIKESSRAGGPRGGCDPRGGGKGKGGEGEGRGGRREGREGRKGRGGEGGGEEGRGGGEGRRAEAW